MSQSADTEKRPPATPAKSRSSNRVTTSTSNKASSAVRYPNLVWSREHDLAIASWLADRPDSTHGNTNLAHFRSSIKKMDMLERMITDDRLLTSHMKQQLDEGRPKNEYLSRVKNKIDSLKSTFKRAIEQMNKTGCGNKQILGSMYNPSRHEHLSCHDCMLIRCPYFDLMTEASKAPTAVNFVGKFDSAKPAASASPVVAPTEDADDEVGDRIASGSQCDLSNTQEGESDFSEDDDGDVSEFDEAVERAPSRSVLKNNQKVKASANKRKAVARPGFATGSERDELVKSFAKRKRTPARGGPLSSSLIAG